MFERDSDLVKAVIAQRKQLWLVCDELNRFLYNAIYLTTIFESMIRIFQNDQADIFTVIAKLHHVFRRYNIVFSTVND